MLRKLSYRLQIFMISTIMLIITFVMAILSYNQYQSEISADRNYTQKMISFFVLELETESLPPERVLVTWGANEVSAILKDYNGNILYENSANFQTDAETLSVAMNEMIAYYQTTSEASSIMELLDVAGSHGERYFGVTATIHAKSGQIYTLEIFYPKTSMWEVLTGQLASHVMVWISSFLCVPSEQVFTEKGFGANGKDFEKSKRLCCCHFPRTEVPADSHYDKSGNASGYHRTG